MTAVEARGNIFGLNQQGTETGARTVKRVHTMAEFQALLQSSHKVIVDFEAAWCGPCKKVGPIFDRLCNEYRNYVFARVDVDEASDVAASLDISAMPTFKVFVDGKEVGTCMGGNEENLVALLKKHDV